MKRVYCLYRVSTKGQVDNDDIPMQRIACREFAKEQGWTVLKEFSEKGVSGFKVSSQKRDAIQQIKLDAEKSLFDVLLVFMFDRLGRRDDETPFIVEWFVKNGIEVWSVKEGEQRFDSHIDKLMNYIRYWQASGESIKTSERVKTRLAQITQEGHFRGGTVPYGYRLVKKGRYNKKNCELYDIEKDDYSAKIVEFIFDKYIYAGMGVQRIANLLNENKVATKTGKPWHPSTILNIIKNRSYIGVIKNGNVTSAIISELQIISEEKYQLQRFPLRLKTP